MRKLKQVILLSSTLIFLAAFNFQDNPPGWYLQTLPVNKPIGDIYFVDSLNGWSCTTTGDYGDTAYILKTTNGGDNWSISFAEDSMSFTKIQFININTGYAGGGFARNNLYKTTNAGNNWVKLFSNLAEPMIGLQFINLDTGWYCNGDIFTGSLYKTTNGAFNWVRQLDQSYNLKDLFFTGNDTGYVIDEQNLYKTINGGSNWNLQYVFPKFLGNGVTFLNSQTGWAIRGDQPTQATIFKTTNGGSNWFIQYGIPTNDSIATTLLLKIKIINKDTVWAVGGTKYLGSSRFRGILFLSTNGGNTWGYQLPDTSINIFNYQKVFLLMEEKGGHQEYMVRMVRLYTLKPAATIPHIMLQG